MSPFDAASVDFEAYAYHGGLKLFTYVDETKNNIRRCACFSLPVNHRPTHAHKPMSNGTATSACPGVRNGDVVELFGGIYALPKTFSPQLCAAPAASTQPAVSRHRPVLLCESAACKPEGRNVVGDANAFFLLFFVLVASIASFLLFGCVKWSLFF